MRGWIALGGLVALVLVAGAAASHAPEIPQGADGELVLRTHHEEGTSLVRLDLDGEGGYTLNRHVGVDAGDAPIPEISGSLAGTPET